MFSLQKPISEKRKLIVSLKGHDDVVVRLVIVALLTTFCCKHMQQKVANVRISCLFFSLVACYKITTPDQKGKRIKDKKLILKNTASLSAD